MLKKKSNIQAPTVTSVPASYLELCELTHKGIDLDKHSNNGHKVAATLVLVAYRRGTIWVDHWWNSVIK